MSMKRRRKLQELHSIIWITTNLRLIMDLVSVTTVTVRLIVIGKICLGKILKISNTDSQTCQLRENSIFKRLLGISRKLHIILLIMSIFREAIASTSIARVVCANLYSCFTMNLWMFGVTWSELAASSASSSIL